MHVVWIVQTQSIDRSTLAHVMVYRLYGARLRIPAYNQWWSIVIWDLGHKIHNTKIYIKKMRLRMYPAKWLENAIFSVNLVTLKYFLIHLVYTYIYEYAICMHTDGRSMWNYYNQTMDVFYIWRANGITVTLAGWRIHPSRNTCIHIQSDST